MSFRAVLEKVWLPFHWSFCIFLIVPLGGFVGVWLGSPAAAQGVAVPFVLYYTVYAIVLCGAAAIAMARSTAPPPDPLAIQQRDLEQLVSEGRRRLTHLLNAATTMRSVARELVRMGARPDVQEDFLDLLDGLHAVQRELRPRMVPGGDFDRVLGAAHFQNDLYQNRVAELARCQERVRVCIRGLYQAFRILHPPPDQDLNVFFSFSPEARAAYDAVGWTLLDLPSVAQEMARRYTCSVEELPTRLGLRPRMIDAASTTFRSDGMGAGVRPLDAFVTPSKSMSSDKAAPA